MIGILVFDSLGDQLIMFRIIFSFYFFSLFSLQSADLLFSLPDAKATRFAKCDSRSSIGFSFTESIFQSKREEILKNIEKFAEELGKERWEQINCVNSLGLSSEEKLQLESVLEFYRQKELELLDFNSNYLLHFDRTNKMSAEETLLTNQFLNAKKDLYSLLYKRSMEFMLSQGDKIFQQKDFKNIYLSLLRLHYEYYSNLSPILRKEIFKGL